MIMAESSDKVALLAANPYGTLPCLFFSSKVKKICFFYASAVSDFIQPSDVA